MSREELFRSSYGRGLPLLGYGFFWLAVTPALFLILDQLFAASAGVITNLIVAAVSAGLAGGAGGAAAMLIRLGRHIGVDEDFLEQSLLLYVAQPLAGLVTGFAVWLVVALPGGLLVNYVVIGQLALARSLSSATFTAVYLLLAWAGGYYQQQGFLKLKSMLVKKTSADPADVDPNAPFSFKEWYRRQRQMIRWSFTWGIFVLLYSIGWLAGLLISYIWSNQSILQPQPAAAILPLMLLLAAWPTAVAGGIGGVISLLNRLYRRISYEQNFDRQELMWYLVQPAVGTVFGVVMYLLVASGYLALQPLFSSQTSQIVDFSPVVALQLVLGWIAGFHQQLVNDLILKLLRDVVSFGKLVLKLLNPFTLFNKTKRQQVLAELGRKNEIFKPVTEENGRSDALHWWAPD